MASLTVLRSGMLTTVQDLGRWGHQSSGVPVAGPMDLYSHRLANRLVGNGDRSAALEVTIVGPELRASGHVLCAVAGAEFPLQVNGKSADTRSAFEVPDGAILRFGARAAGARATLAVRGGFDVPATFGSQATSIVSRMGPFGGRALLPDDELRVGTGPVVHVEAGARAALPSGGARLRVLMGPHDVRFPDAAVRRLLESRFVITPDSNRMGYRLDGPIVPGGAEPGMLSDATPFGSLQVTGSGQPILLMADRPATGGYPRIATVISADLPIAGQLAPGDWIEFVACSRPEAIQALRRQEAALGAS
ncbi:MAG: antagonist of KipI [Acidobacteriota bacterium]